MKLYNRFAAMNEIGYFVSCEASNALDPIIKRWVEGGADPREVELILIHAVISAIAPVTLKRARAMKSEEL